MSKIKYKKNNIVTIEMPLKNYETLLKGHNDLKSALQMMMECHTVYLSDVGNLETLLFNLQSGLGFVSGDSWHTDAILPVGE